jgi:5-methyltetrahydrofolate--homocysteine methyltransferase
MEAWWAGELLDRAVVQVSAPRRGANSPSEWDAWRLVHTLEAPQRAFEEFERHCQATFFGGELAPSLWVNLGPGILAAYLGCTPHIEQDTVWFEASEKRPWEDLQGLDLRPDNPWWTLTRRLLAQAAKFARDKFLVGVTDLNAVLNVLGSLRGTQTLLTDLVDYPAEVRAVSARITRMWLSCYDQQLAIVQPASEGAISWMGIWSPGRGSDVQCDFSAMLSPRMFEEFVLPDLQEQCRRLDHAIYHWDGPGQIPHLDLLLQIPELDGIQWVPGAGNPGPESPKWFPLYRRIQEKRKLLVLQGLPGHDVERLLRELSPKGLLLSTACDSEEQAQDLLRRAQGWTCRS